MNIESGRRGSELCPLAEFTSVMSLLVLLPDGQVKGTFLPVPN